MQDSFNEALKRGDFDAARAINRRAPLSPKKLSESLLVIVTELSGDLQLDAIHFLRSETNVDMNSRYNTNQETVLHIAARQKNIGAFVFLCFVGTKPGSKDKDGKDASAYWNSFECLAVDFLTQIFIKELKTIASRNKRIVVNINDRVSSALLDSAKKIIQDDQLQRITREEIYDFLKDVEKKFTTAQFVELLRHSDYKAYKFLAYSDFNFYEFPTLQAAINNINSHAPLGQEVVQRFSQRADAVGVPNAVFAAQPVESWKSFFALLKKGELEKASECFAATPLKPSVLTQLLLKCIDGFGDDKKLSCIVEFLIEKGADVSARRGGDFKSSLHLALLRNKMMTAAVLVSRLDMASRREKLSRLLLKIMEEKISDEQRAKIVEFLITQGANVNAARQIDLMTPLHIEMRRSGLAGSANKTMEVLFKFKADTKAQNCESKVPQDCALAAMLNSIGSESGKKVGVMWGSGYELQKSPLQKMIDALPDAAVVAPFLAELDDCEVTEIVKQLKYNEYKAYKLFSQRVLDCSKSGPIKAAVKMVESELNAAWLRCSESVREGKEQVLTDVEFLIQCGANINWQEPETGKTMLHYAVERGDEKLTALLKSSGASVDIPCKPFGVTVRQLEEERHDPILRGAGPVKYGQGIRK